MTLEEQLQRFRFDVLRNMPFYGELLLRLPFEKNNDIPTAATDGGKIMYNEKFFLSLNEGQRNYVIFHELFHVLLMHCSRGRDKRTDVWNVACDSVVNNMVDNLMYRCPVPISRPNQGIFETVSIKDTVENLYERILHENPDKKENEQFRIGNIIISNSGDLLQKKGKGGIVEDMSEVERKILEENVKGLVRDSLKKTGSIPGVGNYYIPDDIYNLVESRKLDWRKLLKDFFTEEIGDDASYTTPERKYIHMDLILPGHCLTEKSVEEIWAFVDSSGSISKRQMEEFLTQLYRISKEFGCKFNICYWNTSVDDIYKNITKEKDILKCVPKSSGGTDINCVYEWLKENRVKPDVMLILTDGYFGYVKDTMFVKKFNKKTIVVLNSNVVIDANIEQLGKITRL